MFGVYLCFNVLFVVISGFWFNFFIILVYYESCFKCSWSKTPEFPVFFFLWELLVSWYWISCCLCISFTSFLSIFSVFIALSFDIPPKKFIYVYVHTCSFMFLHVSVTPYFSYGCCSFPVSFWLFSLVSLFCFLSDCLDHFHPCFSPLLFSVSRSVLLGNAVLLSPLLFLLCHLLCSWWSQTDVNTATLSSHIQVKASVQLWCCFTAFLTFLCCLEGCSSIITL